MKKLLCKLLFCSMLLSVAACGKVETPESDRSQREESTQTEEGRQSEEGGQTEERGQIEDSAKESGNDENTDEGQTVSNDGLVHIKTPEDLAGFAARVNEGETDLCAVLDADIDMSGICSASAGNWQSINNFAGEFDGQEHMISNLYCVQTESVAFFNSVKGTIKNLRLENVVMESTENSAAGIARAFSGRIENCCVSGSIKGYKYAGGIVLDMYSDSIVADCVNEAEVFGGYYDEKDHKLAGAAGGIAAWPRETKGIQITGCVNRGTIIGNGNMTGGIAGHCSKGVILVENCINEGNVQGRKGVSQLGSWKAVGEENYTGGIVGYAGANTVITKCVNNGTVSGTGNVGGIVAETMYYLINCANHGELEVTEGGQVYGITRNAMKGLLNCYNTGNMTCDKYGTGVGYSPSAIEVNLYNYGTITSTIDTGILTDVFPWTTGNGSGLMNTYSKENCFVVPDSFQDETPSRLQARCSVPDASFTDGTILNALNEIVADINGDMAKDYRGLGGKITELKENEYFELSVWKTGADGFPCFEWE